MKAIILILLPFLVSAQTISDTSIVKYERAIYFQSDEYVLQPEDKEVLMELIKISNEDKRYKFLVDAHTDDVGSIEYNLKLSKNRKQSVEQFLLQQSISDSLIISNFHGESIPISANKDESARQKNRRAVVQLLIEKQLIEIQGIIEEDSTRQGIIAEITMSSKDFSTKTKSKPNGEYSILAPLNENIILEINAKDYFFESKRIKTSRALIDRIVRLPLVRLELGRKFVFKDMLFEGDKAIMLERSKPAMEQLRRFMFTNNEVCIEVQGHINRTSSPPSPTGSHDHELSIARALVVQESLLSSGIHPDRMLSRGYSNWFMLYPEAKTERLMEQNRRVEIVISECDSTRIIPDQSVKDISIFLEQGLLKKYNKLTAQQDTKDLPSHALADLLIQLKQMELAGMDPSLYSYKELLSAYPDLPPSK